MAKKKRSTTNTSENITLENETSSNSNKESTISSAETETVIENVPVFKSLKFVQSKSLSKKSRVWKSLRQIVTAERSNIRSITYMNIDAAASLKPPKKYSDISGLEAKYTDPQTKVRFANAGEFQFIRTLQPEAINAYLSLRKAMPA